MLFEAVEEVPRDVPTIAQLRAMPFEELHGPLARKCHTCERPVDDFDCEDHDGHCEYCFHKVLPELKRTHIRGVIVQGLRDGHLPSEIVRYQRDSKEFEAAVTHIVGIVQTFAEGGPVAHRDVLQNSARADAIAAIEEARQCMQRS